MSREASPLSNGRLESRLLRSAQYSVYDFDDAIFHNGAPFPYSLYPKGRVWHRSVRAASTVIAGNDYLAEFAAKISQQVVMIPSCVNPSAYPLKSSYELSEIPTLVWLGSPATEPFLKMLTEPLLRINADTPIRLRVISSGARSLGALEEIVDRVQWSAESFASSLADADIGLMPLPDTPFTRGKCAYKLLQYAAAGLPVVGSPVGTNKKVLDDLEGLSAPTPSGWEDAIRDLLATSARARSEIGKAGRNAVDAGYSFEAWAPFWRATVGL
ncbi:glycosyltransferase [Pseudarthrobacter quantipunctorum]|uniref:Glycosyltransferase n=1 Tax=Pseudarthrobacter quantipunctorum TaxID=3128980 RepID=A0ABZ2R7N3_9MICC